MASLTIRNLDDGVKARLRVRAAENGHSMEEEARAILAAAVPSAGSGADLVRRIRAAVEPYGGFDIDLPQRGPMRVQADFGADEPGA